MRRSAATTASYFARLGPPRRSTTTSLPRPKRQAPQPPPSSSSTGSSDLEVISWEDAAAPKTDADEEEADGKSSSGRKRSGEEQTSREKREDEWEEEDEEKADEARFGGMVVSYRAKEDGKEEEGVGEFVFPASTFGSTPTGTGEWEEEVDRTMSEVCEVCGEGVRSEEYEDHLLACYNLTPPATPSSSSNPFSDPLSGPNRLKTRNSFSPSPTSLNSKQDGKKGREKLEQYEEEEEVPGAKGAVNRPFQPGPPRDGSSPPAGSIYVSTMPEDIQEGYARLFQQAPRPEGLVRAEYSTASDWEAAEVFEMETMMVKRARPGNNWLGRGPPKEPSRGVGRGRGRGGGKGRGGGRARGKKTLGRGKNW